MELEFEDARSKIFGGGDIWENLEILPKSDLWQNFAKWIDDISVKDPVGFKFIIQLLTSIKAYPNKNLSDAWTQILDVIVNGLFISQTIQQNPELEPLFDELFKIEKECHYHLAEVYTPISIDNFARNPSLFKNLFIMQAKHSLKGNDYLMRWSRKTHSPEQLEFLNEIIKRIIDKPAGSVQGHYLTVLNTAYPPNPTLQAAYLDWITDMPEITLDNYIDE